MSEINIESYNFEVKGSNWQPLSDIMNQTYNHTSDYIMYVNSCAYGTLCYTHRMVTPEAKDRGRELKAGTEIEIVADNGDHIYLKATGAPVNIEIRETNVQ